MVADDGGMHIAATSGGCDFANMAGGGKVMIKDGLRNTANVTTADTRQPNGVIHVIDAALLPVV